MLGTNCYSVVDADIKGIDITSFFLARSPEAPNITRMVFSCISIEIDMMSQILQVVDSQRNPNYLIPWAE